MRCIYCNSNIPDGAAFCPSCGKQQEKSQRQAPTGFCPVCGSQLAPGAAFCKACGTRNTAAPVGGQGRPAGAQGQPAYQQQGGNMRQGSGQQPGPAGMQGQQPRGMNQGQPPLGAYPQGGQKISPQYNGPGRPVESESSGGKMALIIVFCVLGALIIGMGTMYIYKTFINPSGKDQNVSQEADNNSPGSDTTVDAVTEAVTVADSSEEETEEAKKEKEDERPNADYDFNQDDDLEMTGTLEKNSDGYIIIDWGTKYSFADGKDYLENEKSARLDLSEWGRPIFDYVELGDELNVTGKGYIEDDRVFIQVDKIYDSKGKDITRKKKTASTDNDYIIPGSDTRRLTYDDVKDLSLREVNYAKNEIYARHGRKFASKELRNYFNSKSWYVGTIDPDDFKQSYLSAVESENANYLSEREYYLDPNGYKLDQ